MVMDATKKAGNEVETINPSITPNAGMETPASTPDSTKSKRETEALYKLLESRVENKNRQKADELANRERNIAQQEADAMRRIRDAERASVSDDPKLLDTLDLKYAKEDAEARALKAQTRADMLEAERRTERITTIAEKAGVDVDELIDLSGGNPEKALKIASRLAGTKSPAVTKSVAEPEKEVIEEPTLNVIPSRMAGGGKSFYDLSPKEQLEEGERLMKAGKGNTR
jgi:hypothetical protein